MADHLQITVSVVPIEELTDENSGTKKIIASEVAAVLGGSGTSVDLSNFSNAANGQGYLNGAVYYHDATHSAGGVQLGSPRDAFFIKNTGYKYSSATVVGSSTDDCVMVVLKEVAYDSGVDGGYQNAAGTPQDHFYEIAWLKPGQAIILPLAATNLSVSQFGSNANDLSAMGSVSGTGQARVFLRTFQNDGSAASDGNAVEYLCVT